MKKIYEFLIAVSLLFFIEYVMMIIYTTFIETNISIESIFGKVFYTTIAFGLSGGFIFLLIKAYIQERKSKDIDKIKNDTIKLK